MAKAEPTRWQRDRTIKAIKSLYPPDGIRPKGVSIAALTKRINKLPEFKGGEVSEDTVRRAASEIKPKPPAKNNSASLRKFPHCGAVRNRRP